jgi:hypothetical protein
MTASGFVHLQAKGLIRGIAALVVLASAVSMAAAQPKPTLEYVFDSTKDSLSKAGGILDHSGNKYNGTEISLGAESSFVQGHLSTTTAVSLMGDDDADTGGTGIDTGIDTATVGIDGGPFTVVAWINRATFKQDNMVFGTSNSTGSSGKADLHLGFRKGWAYCGFWGNDSGAYVANIVGISEWHHFAVRYDGTSNQDIFIDGVLINSDPGHGAYGATGELIIGHTYGNRGAFSGAIEHPRVYGGVALRDDQIAADANDNPIPP